eukprot:1282639-Pyramimonas_sp.AAC.1
MVTGSKFSSSRARGAKAAGARPNTAWQRPSKSASEMAWFSEMAWRAVTADGHGPWPSAVTARRHRANFRAPPE